MPMRLVHVMLVLVMAWLCFGFTSPHSSFLASPSYGYMRAIMAREWWAVLCGAIAAFGVVSIVVRHPWMRIASVVILSAGHTALGVLIAYSNIHNVGTGPFLAIAAIGIRFVYSEAHRTIAGRPA